MSSTQSNGLAPPLSSDLLVPPHDREAEAAVIGAALLDVTAVDEILRFVKPEHFHNRAFGRVLQVCIDVKNSGSAYDVVVIANALGEFRSEVGGVAGLSNLMAAVPNIAHAEYYSKIVRADADRRATIESGRQIIRGAYDRSRSVSEMLAEARARLDRIDDAAAGTNEPVPLSQTLLDVVLALEQAEAANAVDTGFPDLDGLQGGGLRPGQLIVLAARPSVGKTALAGQIALHVAEQNGPVLFFTLEQTATELVERFVATVARVDHDRIRRRDLDEMDRFAISDAGNLAAQWPLHIDDNPRRTVGDIAAATGGVPREPMRGRKPKPTTLKLLEGNPGKRALNTREPRPPARLPDCPSWLDEIAHEEWERMSEVLSQMGLLTSADRSALAAYCVAYSRWVKAEQLVQKYGTIVKSPEKQFPMKSPYLTVADQALETMRKLMVEFGLTPSSRSRIKVPEGGRSETAPRQSRQTAAAAETTRTHRMCCR